MKRKTKFLSLIICSLVLTTALLLVACQPKDGATVTVTVDFGLEGVANATFTVAPGEKFYAKLAKQTKPQSSLDFEGYYVDGVRINYGSVAPDSDFTVKAQWLAPYTVEFWLEQADGSYLNDTARTQQLKGIFGSVIEAEAPAIVGYTYDETAEGIVTSATLAQSGTVLKLYYKIASVTVTFDKGFATAATGSMAAYTSKYGESYVIPACGYDSQATFVEFNTKADGTGTSYKSGDTLRLVEDVTLYAVWQATVTQITQLEKDEVEGEYLPGTTETFVATVGTTVNARNPDASKYEPRDVTGSSNSGTVGELGLTLNAYFALRTFTVTYADDYTSVKARWGSEITVRTPANDDPDSEILSYCTSKTGNGRDYPFGSSLQVKSDITLYPVIVDIYTDDAGSGDTVKVRRNMTGTGSVTLVQGGTEYLGSMTFTETVTGTLAEFEVQAQSGKLFGRIYVDEGANKFRYRGEEVGTYMYLDPLYYDGSGEYGNPNPYVMLSLDGYGTGVLAMPESGTERTENYLCSYTLTKNGDYQLSGVLPATGKKVEMYFSLLSQTVDVGEGYSLDGYFMEFGEEGYVPYVYCYNRNLDDSYMLSLDGYGNGTLYELSVDPESEQSKYVVSAEGKYFWSNYNDPSDYEMIFIPQDNPEQAFYFITVIRDSEEFGMFLIRHNEKGEYAHNDGVNPATLYLDGYGGAYYSADGDSASDREGYYVITATDDASVFNLTISFIDDNSELALRINVSEHVFTVLEDGFVWDETTGLLTEYIGSSTVLNIPEGVKKIADGVFKDKKITSVSLPSTLTEIGDYAFEDSSISGASALKTVYFKSTTPPTLGADVFRWIKGNFKIFVPDGCEETYRQAFAAATPSQSGGYGQFVTSRAEQNNKPEFEVKNGVLVSYNNKDDNPQNVAVKIPDGVTEIARGVFLGLDYIVSVNLNGVTVIGADAFRGCGNLRSVTFNPDTQSIGENAFYECGLTELELGSVQSIAQLAFARNFGLVKVTFNGTVGTVEAQAFYECGRVTDADETEVTPLDFVITFHGDTPPTLNGLVFDGVLQLRVYVDSFDIGVAFAKTAGSGWARYASALRVKAGTSETWYDKAQPAVKLEVADRIMYNETYFGLYKRSGNTLTVCWFEFSGLTNTLILIDNKLTVKGNELTGMDMSDAGDSEQYVFVREGTTLTYKGASDPSETLTVTFGRTAGEYCGRQITFDYSNYRTHFDLDGYTYTVTTFNNGTFSYTKSKITVERSYTAADGSTITIYEGDIIQANGCLKNVDGITGANGNGLETTIRGWYLTKASDDVYTFRVSWRSDSYAVTVTILSDTTFSYTWEKASSFVTYKAANGDVAVVTKQSDGSVSSIHILFKTSNGTEEVVAEFVKVSETVYTVTVNSTVTETDDSGATVTRPSEFNGTYTLTLNDDGTFTLVESEV